MDDHHAHMHSRHVTVEHCWLSEITASVRVSRDHCASTSSFFFFFVFFFFFFFFKPKGG